MGVGDRITTDAGADGVVVGFNHGWWEIRLDGEEKTQKLRRSQFERAPDAGEEPDATADAPETAADRLASLEVRLSRLRGASRANFIRRELQSYTTEEIPVDTEEQLVELRRRITAGELPGAAALKVVNDSSEGGVQVAFPSHFLFYLGLTLIG